jgi:hypothetical protein
MLQNCGRFEIHDISKRVEVYSNVGSIEHGIYCSGTFYHMRYPHIMFPAVGPYVAAPLERTNTRLSQFGRESNLQNDLEFLCCGAESFTAAEILVQH